MRCVRTRCGDHKSTNEISAIVVIVSAMSGVTNALIESFRSVSSRGVDNSLALLEEHFSRHVQVAEQFDPGARCRKCNNLIDVSADVEIAELLAQTCDKLQRRICVFTMRLLRMANVSRQT